METNKITLKTFMAATTAILFVEALFYLVPIGKNLSPLAALGIVRCLEAVLLVVISLWLEKNPGAIGLDRSGIRSGFKKGFMWSAGFGISVGVVYVAFLAADINALKFFRSPPASHRQHLFIFLLVGGVIGPIAEEIFFRGIIYGFFRQWGIPVAVISSTLIFILIHPVGANLPVTQAVGGVIFAVAYEKEKSLLVPITIHCLGNLAIFSLTIFTN